MYPRLCNRCGSCIISRDACDARGGGSLVLVRSRLGCSSPLAIKECCWVSRYKGPKAAEGKSLTSRP